MTSHDQQLSVGRILREPRAVHAHAKADALEQRVAVAEAADSRTERQKASAFAIKELVGDERVHSASPTPSRTTVAVKRWPNTQSAHG